MFESFHLFNYFNLATENYSFAHLQFTRRQLQSGWWCTPRCPPSWRWIIDILQTVCLSLAWWYMSAPGNYAQQAGFSVPHVIINSLGCHSSLSSSTFKHIQELPDVTPARVQIASWFSTSEGFFFFQRDISSSSCSKRQGAMVQQNNGDWKFYELWNQLPKAHFHPGDVLYSMPDGHKRVQTQIDMYCVLGKIVFTCCMFSLSLWSNSTVLRVLIVHFF